LKIAQCPTAYKYTIYIIDPNSTYRDEVLELLGAVKLKRGWFFKRIINS